MKFISKNQNLRIILTPSLQANPIVGESAKPGLFVKFESGLAEVSDPALVQRMLQHPGLNRDFIRVADNQEDPYAYQRRENEPEHDLVNIEFGHIGKNLNPKKAKLPPELMKLVEQMADAKAVEKAKTMLNELMQAAAESKKEPGESAPAPIEGVPDETQPAVTEAQEIAQATPKKRGPKPKQDTV